MNEKNVKHQWRNFFLALLLIYYVIIWLLNILFGQVWVSFNIGYSYVLPRSALKGFVGAFPIFVHYLRVTLFGKVHFYFLMGMFDLMISKNNSLLSSFSFPNKT